ncbi:MAG: YggS family pyridoxal phosphate-dependent enzyme [Bacteroidota bacterium]|nr:YggS family pyridoxal phosphate-dependent enzyme [Bacteroidota bacterium]
MSIAQNLQSVLAELPAQTRLVAVSKTKSVDEIMEAYQAGQRIFGENKVQELVPKYNQLPKDIEWHLVGHLQSNKVKYIASFVHYIHSVDSLAILIEIDKQAKRSNRVISCLLQIHVAEEQTKFGLGEAEVFALIDSPTFRVLDHVRVVGLMGMATNTDDEAKIRSEFRSLATIFKKLKAERFADDPDFKELSMGMSDDYHIAMEEGSTLVRVGSKVFGERDYGELPPL